MKELKEAFQKYQDECFNKYVGISTLLSFGEARVNLLKEIQKIIDPKLKDKFTKTFLE